MTPANLPSGVLGQSYSQSLGALSATPPLTFTQTAGALPPGLTLSASGLVSGTPTGSGSYGFAVNVVDSQGRTASANIGILISGPPPTVQPATIPDGVVGQNYSVAFSASGGTPPYRYNLALAVIPGLALDPITGILSGNPTASNYYTIRIDAQDSAGATGSRTYVLHITGNNGILLTPTTLPSGTIAKIIARRLSQRRIRGAV